MSTPLLNCFRIKIENIQIRFDGPCDGKTQKRLRKHSLLYKCHWSNRYKRFQSSPIICQIKQHQRIETVAEKKNELCEVFVWKFPDVVEFDFRVIQISQLKNSFIEWFIVKQGLFVNSSFGCAKTDLHTIATHPSKVKLELFEPQHRYRLGKEFKNIHLQKIPHFYLIFTCHMTQYFPTNTVEFDKLICSNPKHNVELQNFLMHTETKWIVRISVFNEERYQQKMKNKRVFEKMQQQRQKRQHYATGQMNRPTTKVQQFYETTANCYTQLDTMNTSNQWILPHTELQLNNEEVNQRLELEFSNKEWNISEATVLDLKKSGLLILAYNSTLNKAYGGITELWPWSKYCHANSNNHQHFKCYSLSTDKMNQMDIENNKQVSIECDFTQGSLKYPADVSFDQHNMDDTDEKETRLNLFFQLKSLFLEICDRSSEKGYYNNKDISQFKKQKQKNISSPNHLFLLFENCTTNAVQASLLWNDYWNQINLTSDDDDDSELQQNDIDLKDDLVILTTVDVI